MLPLNGMVPASETPQHTDSSRKQDPFRGECKTMCKLPIASITIASVAALSLGCGVSDIAQPSGGSANPVQQAAVITTVGRMFQPAYIMVAPGSAVTFQFGGSHTVTFSGLTPSEGNIPGMTAGNSVSRTFEASGIYYYVCAYHQGMAGVVEVAATDPGVAVPK